MLTVVDFETFGIDKRPNYPPVPVGVAIQKGDQAKYYAWGHLSGNNCSYNDAYEALKEAWNSKVLMHNAKFDLDVAREHFGLPLPTFAGFEDTLFLLYLHDPRMPTFSLKPSSEKILGIKPEEQEAVRDWLITHQPVPNIKIGLKNWGAFIAFAPGELVGKYAIGDVKRTMALYGNLKPEIEARNMLDAYIREKKLLLSLLDNEKRGVLVDIDRLRLDVGRYSQVLEDVAKEIYKRLGVQEINLNSGAELAKALVKSGLADPAMLGVTKTGRMQTNKEALERGVSDKGIQGLLKYHAQLGTCLSTFMEPWLDTASKTGGTIHTSWNQVRNPTGDKGTTTGRLSSSPNFQNIPKEFKPIILPIDVPALPLVRSYVIPKPGFVLIGRDYSQQELRILAHFEDDQLKRKYDEDPWFDLHTFAQTMINEMLGTNFDRSIIKNTAFGLIYGMGIGKLALKNNITVENARLVKDAYLRLLPALRDLYADMHYRSKAHLPIRTWGGREYYCEEPAYIDGEYRHFDYKMVNLLIQGSGSECAKEAIILYEKARPRYHELLLTVHDEFLAMCPVDEVPHGMEVLRLSMESVIFDVPMLSEGKVSSTNWSNMQTYDKHGEIVWHKN